ncbi:MAG: hypothetical protein NTU44_18805, partial [Bacteroidetes bacterium]|nr:hypothetical protein [Bacteroidota bacterium]
MAKKKLVINYDNLPPGVLAKIEKQFPTGWANHVFKVKGAKDSFFYAILVETEDVDYLVKVRVKKDRKGIDADEDFLPEFDDLSTGIGGEGNAVASPEE